MKTYLYCTFDGDNFDPTPLLKETKLKVSDYHYIGDLITKGRLKGQTWDTGSICLESTDESFDDFVSKLYQTKDLIIGNKACWRVLHFYLYYEAQCNLEFDPKVLGLLNELNLVLAVSCIKIEE